MVKTRIGEIHTNKVGCKMTIIAYRGCMDCDIQFDDDFIVNNVQYSNIIKGNIRNPFNQSVLGIGYVGVGKYVNTINGRNTLAYNKWTGMFQRCYSEKYHIEKPTYIGCEVVKEWHNFQNFAAWYEEKYKEGFELDKDILFKGNKVYSPETCCFVPPEINTTLTKCDNSRGKYFIGVSWDKQKKKFRATCNRGEDEPKHIGYFNTEVEAFEAYKIIKENYINKLSEKYKNQITVSCYEALINYKVEITD